MIAERVNLMHEALQITQQLAEIAAVKQKDWREIVAMLDYDVAPIAETLMLTLDEFDGFIANIQARNDHGKENTRSIIDAIAEIPAALVEALTGVEGPLDLTDADTPLQTPACECKCHRRGGEQRHGFEACCERAGETYYDEQGFPL
jgi:hypothetical protein